MNQESRLENLSNLRNILTETEKVKKSIMECAGYGDRFDKYNWTEVGEYETTELRYNQEKRRQAYDELKRLSKSHEDKIIRKQARKHLRGISKPRTPQEEDNRFITVWTTGCLIPLLIIKGLVAYTVITEKNPY